MFRKKSRQQQIVDSFARRGFTDVAERMALTWSDAGEYLKECANVGDRVRSYLDRVLAIQRSLDDTGTWQEFEEWRMATGGTAKIERSNDAFRICVDFHGTWSASFETLAAALEGIAVLSRIQKDLFWVVGWSSWAGKAQLEPGDPLPSKREAEEADKRTLYLGRLADEARRANELPREAITEWLARGERWSDRFAFGDRQFERFVVKGEWTQWDGTHKPHLRYGVADQSLQMQSESPTFERACEFMGIFVRLQTDLARVLAWRWL